MAASKQRAECHERCSEIIASNSSGRSVTANHCCISPTPAHSYLASAIICSGRTIEKLKNQNGPPSMYPNIEMGSN